MSRNRQDYMFVDRQNELLIKKPGEISGQGFVLERLKNCEVYLLDHTGQVQIDDCFNCRILVGPCDGSVFLRDCSDCFVAVACRQLRTRDCSNLTFSLYCATQPSIETSKSVKFTCWRFAYPHLTKQFRAARLDPNQNSWSKVYDFNASGSISGRTANYQVDKHAYPFVYVPLVVDGVIDDDVLPQNPVPNANGARSNPLALEPARVPLASADAANVAGSPAFSLFPSKLSPVETQPSAENDDNNTKDDSAMPAADVALTQPSTPKTPEADGFVLVKGGDELTPTKAAGPGSPSGSATGSDNSGPFLPPYPAETILASSSPFLPPAPNLPAIQSGSIVLGASTVTRQPSRLRMSSSDLDLRAMDLVIEGDAFLPKKKPEEGPCSVALADGRQTSLPPVDESSIQAGDVMAKDDCSLKDKITTSLAGEQTVTLAGQDDSPFAGSHCTEFSSLGGSGSIVEVASHSSGDFFKVDVGRNLPSEDVYANGLVISPVASPLACTGQVARSMDVFINENYGRLSFTAQSDQASSHEADLEPQVQVPTVQFVQKVEEPAEKPGSAALLDEDYACNTKSQTTSSSSVNLYVVDRQGSGLGSGMFDARDPDSVTLKFPNCNAVSPRPVQAPITTNDNVGTAVATTSSTGAVQHLEGTLRSTEMPTELYAEQAEMYHSAYSHIQCAEVTSDTADEEKFTMVNVVSKSASEEELEASVMAHVLASDVRRTTSDSDQFGAAADRVIQSDDSAMNRSMAGSVSASLDAQFGTTVSSVPTIDDYMDGESEIDQKSSTILVQQDSASESAIQAFSRHVKLAPHDESYDVDDGGDDDSPIVESVQQNKCDVSKQQEQLPDSREPELEQEPPARIPSRRLRLADHDESFELDNDAIDESFELEKNAIDDINDSGDGHIHHATVAASICNQQSTITAAGTTMSPECQNTPSTTHFNTKNISNIAYLSDVVATSEQPAQLVEQHKQTASSGSPVMSRTTSMSQSETLDRVTSSISFTSHELETAVSSTNISPWLTPRTSTVTGISMYSSHPVNPSTQCVTYTGSANVHHLLQQGQGTSQVSQAAPNISKASPRISKQGSLSNDCKQNVPVQHSASSLSKQNSVSNITTEGAASNNGKQNSFSDMAGAWDMTLRRTGSGHTGPPMRCASSSSLDAAARPSQQVTGNTAYATAEDADWDELCSRPTHSQSQLASMMSGASGISNKQLSSAGSFTDHPSVAITPAHSVGSQVFETAQSNSSVASKLTPTISGGAATSRSPSVDPQQAEQTSDLEAKAWDLQQKRSTSKPMGLPMRRSSGTQEVFQPSAQENLQPATQRAFQVPDPAPVQPQFSPSQPQFSPFPSPSVDARCTSSGEQYSGGWKQGGSGEQESWCDDAGVAAAMSEVVSDAFGSPHGVDTFAADGSGFGRIWDAEAADAASYTADVMGKTADTLGNDQAAEISGGGLLQTTGSTSLTARLSTKEVVFPVLSPVAQGVAALATDSVAPEIHQYDVEDDADDAMQDMAVEANGDARFVWLKRNTIDLNKRTKQEAALRGKIRADAQVYISKFKQARATLASARLGVALKEQEAKVALHKQHKVSALCNLTVKARNSTTERMRAVLASRFA